MTANQEYGSGNGRTNTIIELELTEEVRKAEIVTEAFYNFRSNSITFKLSPRYQSALVDSPVYLEKIKQTIGELHDVLKSYGVIEEDNVKLEDMLTNNLDQNTVDGKKFWQHYSQQKFEQTNAGQRKRKERNDRKKNALPREVSVAQALMIREPGINVQVTGKLIGGSIVENMIEQVGFRCANCYELNVLEDYRDTRPRLQSEIPSIFEPKHLHKQMCKVCLTDSVPHERDDKYIPARRIELHGIETSNDIPHIDVFLFNNCTVDVLYNQAVKVIGSIQQVKVKDRLLPHIFVGLESDNGVDHIEAVEKIESIEITDEDKLKRKNF